MVQMFVTQEPRLEATIKSNFISERASHALQTSLHLKNRLKCQNPNEYFDVHTPVNSYKRLKKQFIHLFRTKSLN